MPLPNLHVNRRLGFTVAAKIITMTDCKFNCVNLMLFKKDAWVSGRVTTGGVWLWQFGRMRVVSLWSCALRVVMFALFGVRCVATLLVRAPSHAVFGSKPAVICCLLRFVL